MSTLAELPRSRRRRLPAACTAALVTTLAAAPAAAQPGGKESLGSSGPAAESSSERSSERLRHRDRLVTDGDFEELAPESPAPPAHRPDAPRPEAAPGRKSPAVESPATHDEVPAHTPEWKNPGGSDPGRTKLDREGGAVKFGDGERGRRPPSGTPSLEPQYRRGQGRSGNLPGEAHPSRSPGTEQPGVRRPSLGQKSGGSAGLKAPGGLDEPAVPTRPSNADGLRDSIEEAGPRP